MMNNNLDINKVIKDWYHFPYYASCNVNALNSIDKFHLSIVEGRQAEPFYMHVYLSDLVFCDVVSQ